MIIFLRGHIRDSFDNTALYDLIKKLSYENNISIYIHTWNILQSNLSWRHIDANYTRVTYGLIYNYFKDLCYLIKHIIIDDDSNLTYNGSTDGIIPFTHSTPKKGWKNMWYGKYKMIHYIKSKHDISNFVVNMRFDIFNNSNNRSFDQIFNFINNNIYNNFNKNIFINNDKLDGVDNIYIGNINTMCNLINSFHKNLDGILEKFSFYNINMQEAYVYYENSMPLYFNIYFYKFINGLANFSNEEALRHWNDHGQYEHRLYAFPPYFSFLAYKYYNNFHDWSDEQMTWHFVNHGQHEEREYKRPENYDTNAYALLNGFDNWSESELFHHWFNHGRYEGKPISGPDSFDYDIYRAVNNLMHLNDRDLLKHWYNYGQYNNLLCS